MTCPLIFQLNDCRTLCRASALEKAIVMKEERLEKQTFLISFVLLCV